MAVNRPNQAIFELELDSTSTTRIPRPKFIAVAVLTLLLLAIVPLSRARAATAPTNLGTNITNYISQAGNQTIVVPNGNYTGGQVKAAHSAWLVLVAETPGQVVVTSQLDLLSPTSKVAFVGFKFKTFVTTRGTSDIVFWYGDATNPPEAYSGPRPTFLWEGADSTASNAHAYRTHVVGMDIHDIGDDGIQIGGAHDGRIEGVKMWNISNHGINPSGWHNDAIQWTGGASNFNVNQVDFAGHLQVGQDFGGLTGINVSNFWIHDGPNTTAIYDAYTGKGTLTGSRSNGYSWNQPYGDRLDFQDGANGGAPGSKPQIQVSDTNIIKSAPPAGTANPADVWRQANPYNSYASWLQSLNAGTVPPPADGGTTTSTTQPTTSTTQPSTTTTQPSTTQSSTSSATSTTGSLTPGVDNGGRYDLVASVSSDRSAPVYLEQATAAGNIYVLVTPTDRVSRVDFYLDNSQMSGTPFHSETEAPFDFNGAPGANASPFDTRTVANGVHTIGAKVTMTNGKVVPISASFTVKN